MKRIAFIAATLFAGTAHAEPSKDQLCEGWGNVAAKIMELRQDEAPMSNVMKIAASGEHSKVERAFVIEAYKEPAYLSADGKKRAIDSFRNRVELECFNQINSAEPS